LLKQAYGAQLQELIEMNEGKKPSYDREIETQLMKTLQSKVRSLGGYIGEKSL
jgi:hypothetical protein